MSSKWLLLSASLICGLIGGIIGNWIMLPNRNTATFETIRVTKDLLVSPDATMDKGCRISADGTITATGGFVAHQIRGNLIVGRSILASTNATQQTLDNQKIAVEISANEDRGGELILRNRDGILCPAQGPVTKGFATFLGFNKTNNAPAIYTQDISLGAQGRAFVVCAKPKPASKLELETASQANQAAPERRPDR